MKYDYKYDWKDMIPEAVLNRINKLDTPEENHFFIPRFNVFVDISNELITHYYLDEKSIDDFMPVLYPVTIDDEVLISRLALVLGYSETDIKHALYNFATKKMYKNTDFDIYRIARNISGKRANDKRKELVNNFTNDFLKVLNGDKDKFNEFMDHTVLSSFTISFIKVDDNFALYKNIDSIHVEFPIYCKKDPEWLDNNKKLICKYAKCKIKNLDLFKKSGMSINDFRLYKVKKIGEYINFFFNNITKEDYEDTEE